MAIVHLSVSLWNGLDDHVFGGERLIWFKCRASALLLAYSYLSSCLPLFSLFLDSMGWYSVWLGASD